jgi:hypothetical protein
MSITWQQSSWDLILCIHNAPKCWNLVHVVPIRPPKQTVLIALQNTPFSSLHDSTLNKVCLGGGASDVDFINMPTGPQTNL